MKLEFVEFDDVRVAASRKGWLADASQGLAFPAEIERLFDWVQTHKVPSDHDSVAFGVFLENKHVCLGICEVTIQRKSARSKWVKMLRLHLKPSVDEELQAGNSNTAMQVFTQCMVGAMDLQLAHQATTLKIYGRTHEQLAFLQVLAAHVDKSLSSKPDFKVKVAIEGRFLSLNFA